MQLHACLKIISRTVYRRANIAVSGCETVKSLSLSLTRSSVSLPVNKVGSLAIQLHAFLKNRSRAVYLRDNMAAFILYVSIILCIYTGTW